MWKRLTRTKRGKNEKTNTLQYKTKINQHTPNTETDVLFTLNKT